MPNTTNWREIRRRRPPNETAVELEKLRLRLAILREQLGASQVDVADALGTSQSNVSQLERSNDQMLSSIAKYVHALGGELRVTAVIGDTTYTLLDDIRETPARRRRRASGPRRAQTHKPARA
jgi:transcriptional regulator with XRE-family HTH domain